MPVDPLNDSNAEPVPPDRSTVLNDGVASPEDFSLDMQTQQRKTDAPHDTMAYPSDSLLGETVTLNLGNDQVLGNFRLVSKLGSGGFGAVYKAEDLRLERHVAIKVAFRRAADAGDDYYRRVFHEGRAAAALDHPNIVSVYDVAELNGKPYIVTQFIDGVTLRDRLSSGTIDHQHAVQMMVQVARALDYAHEKGVVHRDLKPGNILLDANGVPYVNDFGIAKHSEGDDTISSESSIIGTPAYMSPEQASGNSRDADRRSDVYSLGVILYELLCGEKPFRGSSRMLLHHVIHTEPQSPCTLNQTVAPDLETICLKCLEKSPERRYPTCHTLALELQRYLDGEPIEARPVSKLEQFTRQCRRNPNTTAISGALIAAVLLGLVGVTWQWRRAEFSRRQEQAAREEVESSRQQLAEEATYSRQLLHDAESQLAFDAMEAGDHQKASEFAARLTECGDVEAELLAATQRRYGQWAQHSERIVDVAVSDDERFVAAAGLRTLLVWDSETKQITLRFRQRGKALTSVVFAPDSHLLAWSGKRGDVYLKDLDAKSSTQKWTHTSAINVIRFCQDGVRLLAGDESGNVVWWSIADEQKQSVNVSRSAIQAADFVSADLVIVGDSSGLVQTCELVGERKQTLHRLASAVSSLDVSDDQGQFAAGSRSGLLVVGKFANPAANQVISTNFGPLLDLEFWSENQSLVSTNLFGRLNVWKLPELSVSESHRYLDGDGHFAILRKSDQLLVGAGDGELTAISCGQWAPNELRLDRRAINDMVWQGDLLVVCHENGPATVIHRQSGQRIRTVPSSEESDVGDGPVSPKSVTCVDRDDEGLVFGTDDGRILLFESRTARTRLLGRVTNQSITAIDALGDGSFAFSGGAGGGVVRWDLARGDRQTELAALRSVVRDLRLSPDETVIAAVTSDGIAMTLNAVSGVELDRLDLESSLNGVAWSADGTQLALASSDGNVLVYPADLSGDPVTLAVHNGTVSDLAFSSSGKRMLSVGSDDRVVFSNLVTGRQVAVLEHAHSQNIRALAISPDGLRLATGDAGGKVRLWDLGE